MHNVDRLENNELCIERAAKDLTIFATLCSPFAMKLAFDMCVIQLHGMNAPSKTRNKAQFPIECDRRLY